MTPDLTPAQTRALLATVAVYERDGRATVRSVAREYGCNVSTIWFHLRRLRSMGLVGWDEGKDATLRPMVEVVAHG